MHDESAPNTTWSGGLSDDISRVILSEETIQRRVAELGAQIAADYQGRDLLVVGVLSGSFLFIADLVRQINLPLALDFISVSSYGDRTRSSGVVRMLKDLNQPIAGRDVLLVEDIIDTGLTLSYLIDNLRTRQPASLAVATLLDKKEARVVKIDTAYIGFECPNEFVVGYGLDYAGRYRNLPYIGVLRPEVYAGGDK
ncbi:MAG: hypoxanthine phosphoribosyltransferase [Myxococcales bacterium]|nr:hypoxanthine phosphoribosyltransferase [Myxococcales bacterium]MCB9700317.1 hypoxanthine phosphoribosyltransferase [Myxococcales bacterium]